MPSNAFSDPLFCAHRFITVCCHTNMLPMGHPANWRLRRRSSAQATLRKRRATIASILDERRSGRPQRGNGLNRPAFSNPRSIMANVVVWHILDTDRFSASPTTGRSRHRRLDQVLRLQNPQVIAP